VHIGFFTDSYLPRTSGVVRAVAASAEQLRLRGHRVTIVAPSFTGHTDADRDVIRVPSVTPPGHPDFPVAVPYPGASVRAVRALGLDVVHTHSPFLLGGFGWWTARSLGRPVLFTYHTRYDEYAHYAPLVGEFARPFLAAYATAYCNRCDCVLAPVPSIAALLRESGVRTRVVSVPSASVDTAAFAAAAQTDGRGAAVRATFGIPAGAPLLVFVGRLAREKNAGLLVAALAALPSDTWLLLVGDGPDRPLLEAQARDRGVAGRTILAGTQPPVVVAGALAAADVFVFPSTTETLGLAMLEAMAAGCPVVAVQAPASSDVLRDGETGRLVPGDPAAFAGAVRELLGQPDRRKTMGEAARAAAADYDHAPVAERLLAVYQDLIAVRGTAPAGRP
jgi:1,2-diacylglycerol 3-alpha-glucosyltransferase